MKKIHKESHLEIHIETHLEIHTEPHITNHAQQVNGPKIVLRWDNHIEIIFFWSSKLWKVPVFCLKPVDTMGCQKNLKIVQIVQRVYLPASILSTLDKLVKNFGMHRSDDNSCYWVTRCRILIDYIQLQKSLSYYMYTNSHKPAPASNSVLPNYLTLTFKIVKTILWIQTSMIKNYLEKYCLKNVSLLGTLQ